MKDSRVGAMGAVALLALTMLTACSPQATFKNVSIADLQARIEWDAKKLCAPDIVFRFIPRDIPCRSSDGKPSRTEDGYTVLTVDPDHTVTEKLDILKREIWNHL